MKRPPKSKVRKAIRKQLGHLARNLLYINRMADKSGLDNLSKKQYRNLLVVTEIHRQQQQMFAQKTHSITGRIVNLAQPHIRPIVRGKAKAKTEFGAKLSISVIDGYTFIDQLSFDAYNESDDLPSQIEAFHKRTGHYPESVHADKIYGTRKNRDYCKKHGIRLSAPRLGRPPKETLETKAEQKARRKQLRQDEIDRIPVEGKFGQAKRRFGLGLIKSKLPETNKSTIHINIILLNLEKWLKVIFHAWISKKWQSFLREVTTALSYLHFQLKMHIMIYG